MATVTANETGLRQQQLLADMRDIIMRLALEERDRYQEGFSGDGLIVASIRGKVQEAASKLRRYIGEPQ